MCGIVGFLAPGLSAAEYDGLERFLARAVEQLAPRGPDGEGMWIDRAAGIGLAHRRLAIVDLSTRGAQPMASPCGRYITTFNGEIYNFRELRHALQGACRFASNSDTEVLLAALSRWTLPAALQQLTGMYAFGVWDRTDRVLTLVRDRMGEKPLYYANCDGIVLFASELKTLARHRGLNKDVDRDALCLYLRLGYIPAPWTVLRGVRKLPPGCLLTIRHQNAGTLPQPVEYWSLAAKVAQGQDRPFAGDDTEAVAHLEHLLGAAIQRQLGADVPVGMFLSGGIDSSYVAALASRHAPALRTFTIGSTDARYDEAVWAGQVSAHLAADNTMVRLAPDVLADTAASLAASLDEPFADSSLIPTYLLAKLARSAVKVCLAGDGGDELFGGYWHYTSMMPRWLRLARMPLAARRALAGLIALAAAARPKLAHDVLRPTLRRLAISGDYRDALYRATLALRAPGPHALYLAEVTEWQSAERMVIGGREPDFRMTRADANAPANFLRHMMTTDATVYLPDNILTKVDRASMANGLEARLPFLDTSVVEFSCTLPDRMLVEGGTTKRVLRRALGAYIPRRLIDRPKRGFGIPLDDLLRGSLRPWAEALLDENRIRREGLLDATTVRRRWREHLARDGCNWGGPLWIILMFQSWHESFRVAGAA